MIAADGGNSNFAKRIGLLAEDRWSIGNAMRGYYCNISDLDDLFLVYVPLIDPTNARMLAGYLQLLNSQTAIFYELAGRLGGIVGAVPDQLRPIFGEFGRNLGLAYRLTSDVLDLLVDDNEPLEHPLARTLEDGLFTLPIIYTLASTGQIRLQALLRQRPINPQQIRGVLAILRTNGALAYTWNLAKVFAVRAQKSLEPLPNLPAKEALHALADFVVTRDAHQLLSSPNAEAERYLAETRQRLR